MALDQFELHVSLYQSEDGEVRWNVFYRRHGRVSFREAVGVDPADLAGIAQSGDAYLEALAAGDDSQRLPTIPLRTPPTPGSAQGQLSLIPAWEADGADSSPGGS